MILNTIEKEKMITIIANFLGHTSKFLPDDVLEKIEYLKNKEQSELSKMIYETMMKNQLLARSLDRPSCQDTGAIQYFLKCGANFPYINDISEILRQATIKATKEAPLRHNAVESFDEYNTGSNTGTGIPSIFWEIEPNNDSLEIYTYMAGGGCSLPGKAKVLMPSEGYEGVVKFVLDIMTSYGLNACPPLLVGIGIATSVETAAILSKKALMRPINSSNKNKKVAELETLLEKGINDIGLGPQGLMGENSVLGVNIENTARHPSVIGVAVNVGCWSHRRGKIIFDKNLNFSVETHKNFKM